MNESQPPRVTERRPLPQDGLAGRRRMLRATQTFEYDDPVTGRREKVWGEEKHFTRVHPDHYLAKTYPDRFVVSDQEVRTLVSVPVPFDTPRPDPGDAIA